MSTVTTSPLTVVDEDPCWKGFAKIYRRLEEAPPYQGLVRDMAHAMNPQEGEHWLDAGCGSGTMTDVIFDGTLGECDVIAVDASEIMLDHVSKRFGNNPRFEGRFHVQKVDLRCPLPFHDEQFDGVVGNLVFPYIDRWCDGQTGIHALECCFQEVHRVLKPGGKFVWSTPRENPNFVWIFLASWKAWIKPANLGVALKILSYAQELKRRWKQGMYHYLNDVKLVHLMHSVGFSYIDWGSTYANQGRVIKGIKRG